MARIDIHGGDFAKGLGWFYADNGFVLRDKDGKPASIPLARLEAADQASEASLRIFGVSDSMRADFGDATAQAEPIGWRVFIAIFADGRLLLASTDQSTFNQTCGPSRPCSPL